MRWRLSILLCLGVLAACAPAVRVEPPADERPARAPAPTIIDVPLEPGPPVASPTPREPGGMVSGVLARVNALRASGHDCGGGSTGRVPPLTPHEALSLAARLHNEDMVRTGNLSHQGSDGQGLAARMGRVGYEARHRGENIASFRSIDAAFGFWLSSSIHCRSIMSPDYIDIGVSVIRTEPERYYLTLVFGSPR